MDYPCLKCIVEYLEANQRFRLASKCPTIRKIERSIPLHLELITIDSTTIKVNDYRFELKKEVTRHEEKVLPGDIVFDNRRDVRDSSYHYQAVCSSVDMDEDDDDSLYETDEFEDDVQILKNFPEGVHYHDAMKWLGCYLFENRSEITTRKLVINKIKVLRLPADFKLKKVGILETEMEYLDGISKFVHPVVEKIILPAYIRSPEINHPMIQMAKEISFKSMTSVRELSFVHKNVELLRELPEVFFKQLIQKWIADSREIGSSFTFYSHNIMAEFTSLQYFEKEFNGRTIYRNFEIDWYSNDTEEDLVPPQGSDILYTTCLPMNSTSDLKISLSKTHQRAPPNKIVLEVVPFGSLPTLKI